MKVILISVGTLGDVEPFLAIGELLMERGCRVIGAFPGQFRKQAEDTGLEFASLGSKFMDLLDSEDGRAAMGGSGSGWKKFLATIRLAAKQKDANKELLHKQFDLVESEKPEILVYNGKAVYPIFWELRHPGSTVFISPLPYMHYVKGHTHVAFNSNYGPLLNKMTFSLARFGMVTTVMISKRWLQIGGKISRKAVREVLRTNRSVYTVSPTLFPRPPEWEPFLRVLGYHERKQGSGWKPDHEIMEFLDRHEKVLLVTFGSMLNSDPEKKTRVILEILRKNRIPAIINKASGGLVEPEDYDRELIHFVPAIPYHWILPKVYGVVHHGGSGTTHLAVKYGCASLIIPHIIDQHVWNRIISGLELGPAGPKIGKINRRRLEPRILDLLQNPVYKQNAMQASRRMEEEDYRDELYEAIVRGRAIVSGRASSVEGPVKK